MPNSQKDFLTSLTATEMKRLLVARERIDVLLGEKEKLTKALDKIESELLKLMEGAGGGASPKKHAAKKAGRKKKVVKKVTRKKTAKKKAPAKKTPAKKAPAVRKPSGRIKLEDVVVKVIKANRKPMTYKELIAVIMKKKLFTSKSSNFDNVLRRTLSTSKLVKRVGRGIYTVA